MIPEKSGSSRMVRHQEERSLSLEGLRMRLWVRSGDFRSRSRYSYSGASPSRTEFFLGWRQASK